jgi:beta-glucosidase
MLDALLYYVAFSPFPYCRNKNTCGEDDDRTDFALPGVQAGLLEAIGATGKPVVAILIHGRPVTFAPSTLAAATAIIAAWRPGCEGGHGLMDIILGRSPPSGRLAQSWVRTVGQVKSQASPWFSLLQGDFNQVPYNGDIMSKGVTDESSSWSPAFPFGFGLSYTTWTIELLSVAIVANGAQIAVSVNVTNTGSVASKQVVGVYYSRPLSAFVRHSARLLAFAKTSAPVAPGAVVTLEISAPISALASYDPATQQMLVEPGNYTVTVGPDSITESGSANLIV